MRPSEYLKSKGWKPARADVHPQSTTWAKGDMELAFIDALLMEWSKDPGAIEFPRKGKID